MKFKSYLRLLPLIVLFASWANSASGIAYYVVNSNPWGSTQNQTCMTNVFGPQNVGWIQASYSTPIATVFSAANAFVMIEGGEGNSGLPAYITANITAIENWVNAGGRLFLNAAPNYGVSQNWGFNSTVLNYAWYSNSVTTNVPANPIFLGPYLPTATNYTGTSFGHGSVSGIGLTSILYDATQPAGTRSVLSYKTWGNGIVFFGGCTMPNFWSPNPQGVNLWQNIFAYVNTYPLVGITTTVSGAPWCAGANITVNYAALNLTFVAGNQFKVQLSDAAGSFASPTQIGILTSTSPSGSIACTIPAAQAGGTGYRIRTVSTTPVFTGADNGTNLVINPQLTPSVTITASPGSSICAGTNVTFTASVTNGGPAPTYAWKLNGNPVGGNTPTYSNAALANGNQITCVITSNAPCATPTTATSNIITMTVNALVTPTISVTSVPAANAACVGQPVTFTAAVTNQGAGPLYQWYKNGNPVGTNSTTYTDPLLTNGDIITCMLTSNAPCLLVNPVTSAPLTITVNPNVTHTVSISANPGNAACAGSNVTFTATTTNAGPTPTYQWKVDGNPVGGNTATYSTTTLTNGNVVTCTVTSSAPCATPVTLVSNSIAMTIDPVVAPTINVSASPGNTICIGTSTTFTAAITNGGPSPTYQWKVNGNPAGANSNTFISNTLANGDIVTCTLISSAPCPTPATATATMTMTVNNTVPASVGITVAPGTTICAGTLTTFTASPVNGGPTPVYQWYKNGVPVGSNNPVYTNAALNNSDVIYCTMTSNATCAVPLTSTSNSITMLVNPTVTPTVSLSTNTGNTICAGTSVTFAASPVNGGNAPAYQWYLNGNPVGTNSGSYITNTLANNDAIYCVMTSNAVCPVPASVTSSTITMTVNPLTYPTATINVSPGISICSGDMAVFNATPLNAGPTPSYQWYKNGVPVGTNNSVYTDNTLNNSDYITCRITSSALCATPPAVYSNGISMSVTSTATPTVTVTGPPANTICSGALATFTTQIANGGNAPVYVWKVNGNAVGGNTPSYSTNGLNNGDVVTCELTSSFTCAVPLTVTSAPSNMTVNPLVTPDVSITSNTSDSICPGTLVTFTAVPVNGGLSPVYVWKKNGGPVGGPGDTYSNNTLNDGDIITCDLMSSEACPTPPIVGSNSKTITVNEWMTPKVYINADPSVLMCSGAPVVFNATVDSAGDVAGISYQWMLNGNPVGGNTPSYSGTMLNSGDMVYYIMSSTAPCLTKTVDTSATDTIKWFNSGYLAGATGITETNTVNITNQNTGVRVGYVDCDLITSITPTGASPVSGIASFKVTVDPEVTSYNGQPYVQRHYDIEPQTNPAASTASIELYAYESEFMAYNAFAQTTPMYFPPLPTNKLDNGNVRITIFHGTGTAPGNYSGQTQEIAPTVSWDIANNWWVMKFPVTGFSGYYIHTGEALSVSNTTGIDGFTMQAYPNPVKDKVEVKLTGVRGANSSLVVTDLTGRTIINVDMDNNKAIIDMSGLASGMYMLRYSDDTRNQTVKITKE